MVHPNSMAKLRHKKKSEYLPNNKVPRIDFGALKKIVTQPTKHFHTSKRFGNFTKVQTPVGPYFYKDNNANILLVAHLDSVQEPHWAGVLNFKDDTKIYATSLDDRLGAYVILDLLADTDLEYDILLTTNEEAGSSSAMFFDPPSGKEYNWIAEFDRGGERNAVYNFNSTDWRRSLTKMGLAPDYGSYSDIKELETLGVCGVNIGIGYYDYHGLNAYASLNVIKKQVAKFIDFYHEYSEIKFEHTPRLNKFNNGKFKFDPMILDRFTFDEIDEAIALYEQGDKRTITPEVIRLQRKLTPTKRGKLLIHKPDFSPPPDIKGSEDSKTIIYPMKPGIKYGILSKHLTFTERCVECGHYFEVAEAHTEPYCEECKEVIANRHAKDEIVKLSSKEITDATELAEIFTALRMDIPEQTAKDTYDMLVKEKRMKPFSHGKSKVRFNYPVLHGPKVFLTQTAMAIFLEKENVKLSTAVGTKTHKFLSKIESGHRSIYEEKYEDARMRVFSAMKDYAFALMKLVSQEQMPQLLQVTKFLAGQTAGWKDPLTEKQIEAKKEPEAFISKVQQIAKAQLDKSKKVTLKSKFRLRKTSSVSYDFVSRPNEEGDPEYHWEEMVEKAKV